MSTRHRTGTMVLEPIRELADTAHEARWYVRHLLEPQGRAETATRRQSITVRCWRNTGMTREFAEELHHQCTVVLGVPQMRIIDPDADAATHFFDIAARHPAGTVTIHSSDGHRVNRSASPDLETYLRAAA